MDTINQLLEARVVITAEIGINHNGNLDMARELIQAAKNCGVDAVKFQAFKTDQMYSRHTPGFSHTENDIFKQIQGLEIQSVWWQELKEMANGLGLLFSCSIFDETPLPVLQPLGLDFVKIASAEINNMDLIGSQIGLSETFVISTGMSYLDEITETVRLLKSKRVENIILLECTSSYPAPASSIHLLNIDFLKSVFALPVGFSDHAEGIHHSIAAVARGARFIEKHFTLDKGLEGPDHKLSADIGEMTELVRNIREIEQSMKCNRKMEISELELETRKIGRKSIIASETIEAGGTISKKNTILKRPGMGIQPREQIYLFGRKALKKIEKDHWISWDMVE